MNSISEKFIVIYKNRKYERDNQGNLHIIPILKDSSITQISPMNYLSKLYKNLSKADKKETQGTNLDAQEVLVKDTTSNQKLDIDGIDNGNKIYNEKNIIPNSVPEMDDDSSDTNEFEIQTTAINDSDSTKTNSNATNEHEDQNNILSIKNNTTEFTTSEEPTNDELYAFIRNYFVSNESTTQIYEYLLKYENGYALNGLYVTDKVKQKQDFKLEYQAYQIKKLNLKLREIYANEKEEEKKEEKRMEKEQKVQREEQKKINEFLHISLNYESKRADKYKEFFGRNKNMNIHSKRFDYIDPDSPILDPKPWITKRNEQLFPSSYSQRNRGRKYKEYIIKTRNIIQYDENNLNDLDMIDLNFNNYNRLKIDDAIPHLNIEISRIEFILEKTILDTNKTSQKLESAFNYTRFVLENIHPLIRNSKNYINMQYIIHILDFYIKIGFEKLIENNPAYKPTLLIIKKIMRSVTRKIEDLKVPIYKIIQKIKDRRLSRKDVDESLKKFSIEYDKLQQMFQYIVGLQSISDWKKQRVISKKAVKVPFLSTPYIKKLLNIEKSSSEKNIKDSKKRKIENESCKEPKKLKQISACEPNEIIREVNQKILIESANLLKKNEVETSKKSNTLTLEECINRQKSGFVISKFFKTILNTSKKDTQIQKNDNIDVKSTKTNIENTKDKEIKVIETITQNTLTRLEPDQKSNINEKNNGLLLQVKEKQLFNLQEIQFEDKNDIKSLFSANEGHIKRKISESEIDSLNNNENRPKRIYKSTSTDESEINFDFNFVTAQDIYSHTQNYRKPKIYLKESKIHGFGCFIDEKIKKNIIIGEYTGQFITDKLADIREKIYQKKK